MQEREKGRKLPQQGSFLRLNQLHLIFVEKVAKN